MARCATCSAELTPGTRFCAGCGSPVTAGPGDDAETLAAPAPPAGPSAPRPGRGPSDPAAMSRMSTAPGTGWSSPAGDDAFLAPGTVIGERYRIVARLGRGGMGEVFRADDLKVGQAVALKFLPRAVSENPAWLDRFRGEVRIARQVAHPNVCRMYDLGEAATPDGRRTFLSMEYIDGEDMASLLRRIGRLPKDKAVQVARQIAAGLAAAHAQGVIHRDLKPANIMLDGRGHARLMDFGIAGLAEQIAPADIRSGTPAYMAPEQREGREVTARSDLYALGLVLYELFTGRRALAQDLIDARPGTRTSADISRPSTHAEDLDPAIDRLIMRCLQDDPAARPGSAMAVIAALPGGDPLRAAVEAGETPSPELVAAAGARTALRVSKVGAMAAASVVLLALALLLGARQSLLRFIDLPRSPEVLADRAREILRAAGYTETPADAAWGLHVRGDYLEAAGPGEADPLRPTAPERRARLEALRSARPQPVVFWYRTSPSALTPWKINNEVSPADPPRTEPGMTYLALDSAGRLEALSVVTPRFVSAAERTGAEAGPAPDWAPLFAAAGLELRDFRPAAPARTPPHYADARGAWEQAAPGPGGRVQRVEAAAYRGRPVYFITVQPWEVEAPEEARLPARARIMRGVMTTVVLLALGFSAWQARRNVKQGRGDLSGARALAWAMFAVMFAGWLLRANHQADVQAEWNAILMGTALPLLVGGIAWMVYLALEPFVRRRDPVMLVSWTRLLAGGFSDPAVGRDALIGVIGGLSYLVLSRGAVELAGAAGGLFIPPVAPEPVTLAGWSGALAPVMVAVVNAVLNGMLFVLAFVALLAVVKRRWLAGLLLLAPAAVLTADQVPGGAGVIEPITMAIGGLGLILYLVRFGMLAVLIAMFTASVVAVMPATADLDAWYGRGMLVAIAVVLGLTAWAARAARGGRWSEAA